MIPSASPGDNEAKASVKKAFVFPASFAQRRLWFLHQFDPASSVYNIPAPIRVTVPLNISVLERSLNEIVRRHESLRTTFTTIDGELMQVIAPSQTLKLEVFELRTLPEAERESEAQRLIMIDAQRSFSLSRGPLLRASLLWLADADCILLLTMHHIISDGWSIGVLIRELSALYTAFSLGRPSPLPEMTIQYADFSAWQSEWLQGEVLERHLNYWKTQLAGAPELLNLPVDRARPMVQSYHGGGHAVTLEPRLYEAIREVGQREGATPFMTLLAAFKVLLYRYTGETDLVVGSPIANRTRPEIEGLIGLFVNTLVLRTDLSGDPTFIELLGRVREVTLGAYAHQDLPFEKLVQEMQPARNLSHNPLFQVMFILQSAERLAAKQSAAKQSAAKQSLNSGPETFNISTETSKFDLTLSIVEANRTATAMFEYNSDLFEKATIELFAEHFHRLLQSIARRPDQRICDLPLLTEAERRKILVEWNQTGTEAPTDGCLHHLIERQAERTPEAVAIVYGDEQLAYADLNARANQLAHALQEMGVGPETLVGLCAERTADMIVGLLGVLKAGGAYVPLDPTYPQQRLAFMLEDSRAKVLITQQHLISRFPELQAQVLYLDSDRDRIARYSTDNPISGANASTLAYVLYTSGSTGKPKGVAIEHRSVVAFLRWARDTFDPDEMDGVLASTSVCFDLSVFEMFAPISWGGKVILARDALQLPSLAASKQVRLINTVPSAMAELLRLRAVPDSVRTVNLAGEPLPNFLAQQLYKLDGVKRVWNLYGPTEDTTYSTCALVEKGSLEKPRIGRPLANKRVYLLDERLQPVPIGVPGQLYIGGAGLARGYFNRPDLTADRFTPDPFGSEPGARLYRTGDLTRLLPDGAIEYLGRMDHQVKVRGYRIELGEIEAALRGHPGISEVVVTAHEDILGDKRLVAYAVFAGDQNPSADELRKSLKAKLPDYMVPSDFAQLAELPRLPNGKLNKRALPAPEGQRMRREVAYVAPRNPVEQQLAQLFSEILKQERVGVHDNFFEVGGHSLLATRVVAKVQEVFGKAVPIRRFFETPTIEGLALAISETPVEGAAIFSTIPRLGRESERGPDVSGLSDDEVESMLEKFLTEGNDKA